MQAPQRRVYKTEEKTVSEECTQCKGRGRIFRVVDCCENGCNECSYTKIKISAKWRELRLKGEEND